MTVLLKNCFGSFLNKRAWKIFTLQITATIDSLCLKGKLHTPQSTLAAAVQGRTEAAGRGDGGLEWLLELK